MAQVSMDQIKANACKRNNQRQNNAPLETTLLRNIAILRDKWRVLVYFDVCFEKCKVSMSHRASSGWSNTCCKLQGATAKSFIRLCNVSDIRFERVSSFPKHPCPHALTVWYQTSNFDG